MPSAPLEKIELPSTALPVPDTTRTPVNALKAMTLPSPALTPPTVLLLAELVISTPSAPLASAAVPFFFVPMKLPWTLLETEEAPAMTTPLPALPEMTLRSAAVEPPSASKAPRMTPSPMFPSAAFPVVVVPMRLPLIVLPGLPVL